MSSEQRRSKERIVVLCRYPVPGRVKTRLARDLGGIRAAEVHRVLAEGTVTSARSAARERRAGLVVSNTGGGPRAVRRWLGPGLEVAPQPPGGLGDRMAGAFEEAFASGARRVVLVGTDIPGLTAARLHRAFEALDQAGAVLGPSLDGGYWLVGLRRPADLFSGIPWGTGAVLQRTLARAEALGLRVHRLETLRDVDRLEDLRAEGLAASFEGPYVTVIIPALNEARDVVRAVASARGPSSEVIVVDGGSADDTCEHAARAGARVLRAARGRARQQNLGAAEARGRVLLFLHADSVLPSGYDLTVFRTLIDRGTAGGAFRFRTDGRGPRMAAVACLTNLRSRLFQLPYGDQALFLRRETFEKAGGFPMVPIAEDLLLVRRLARMGRVRTAPEAVTTSARRWRRFGVLRTTLINQRIVAGLLLGRPPEALASLYPAARRSPQP